MLDGIDQKSEQRHRIFSERYCLHDSREYLLAFVKPLTVMLRTEMIYPVSARTTLLATTPENLVSALRLQPPQIEEFDLSLSGPQYIERPVCTRVGKSPAFMPFSTKSARIRSVPAIGTLIDSNHIVGQSTYLGLL